MHRQTNIMYNIKLFSSKKKNHIHQRHNILRDRPFSFEGCDLLSSFLHVLPRKSYDTLSRTECKVKILKYVEGQLDIFICGFNYDEMGEKSHFMQTKAIYQNISWQGKKRASHWRSLVNVLYVLPRL
jgi:hypothetical protein